MIMFEESIITATITCWEYSNGFFGESLRMNFKDGKTIRAIEFSELSSYTDKNYTTGENIRRKYPTGAKIKLIKVGKGKYAGYRLEDNKIRKEVF